MSSKVVNIRIATGKGLQIFTFFLKGWIHGVFPQNNNHADQKTPEYITFCVTFILYNCVPRLQAIFAYEGIFDEAFMIRLDNPSC